MGGSKMPIYALSAAFGMLVLAVVLLLFTDPEQQTTPVFVSIVGLIITTIPSLLAAAFAERAVRDIRNGVLKGKVKEAINETLPSTVLNDDAETVRRDTH